MLYVSILPALTISHSRRVFSDAQKENMINARDTCLGDRKSRSRTAPKKVNGEVVGGTAFERNGRAFPVVQNTRCYGIGNSAEPNSGLMAPHKGNKVLDGYEQDALDMREGLLKVRRIMCKLTPWLTLLQRLELHWVSNR